MSICFNFSNTFISTYKDLRKEYGFISADIVFTGSFDRPCIEGYHFCHYSIQVFDHSIVYLLYRLENNENAADAYSCFDVNLSDDERIFFCELMNEYETNYKI